MENDDDDDDDDDNIAITNSFINRIRYQLRPFSRLFWRCLFINVQVCMNADGRQLEYSLH